jgi:uncharacterized membrane protein YphA (DoxX/SURF4 family)
MPFKPNENLIPPALSVLRIVSAYLLLQHGTAKFLGFRTWPRSTTCSRCRCPGSPASSSSSAARCC